jgi:hypothetical protein
MKLAYWSTNEPLPFLYPYQLIRTYIRQPVYDAARPPNFDHIGMRHGT